MEDGYYTGPVDRVVSEPADTKNIIEDMRAFLYEILDNESIFCAFCSRRPIVLELDPGQDAIGLCPHLYEQFKRSLPTVKVNAVVDKVLGIPIMVIKLGDSKCPTSIPTKK